MHSLNEYVIMKLCRT